MHACSALQKTRVSWQQLPRNCLVLCRPASVELSIAVHTCGLAAGHGVTRSCDVMRSARAFPNPIHLGILKHILLYCKDTSALHASLASSAFSGQSIPTALRTLRRVLGAFLHCRYSHSQCRVPLKLTVDPYARALTPNTSVRCYRVLALSPNSCASEANAARFPTREVSWEAEAQGDAVCAAGARPSHEASGSMEGSAGELSQARPETGHWLAEYGTVGAAASTASR